MYVFLFVLILIAPLMMSAQELVLEDYSHSGSKYLNALVNADSTSAEFIAGTRIYILRKDGQYLFNATMTSYSGKPKVFKVDPTDPGYYGIGMKPECYGVLSAANALPGNFIAQQNGGLVELHNLNISNYFNGFAGGSDSLIQRQQGGLVLIGTAGGTGRIKIDSCVLHGPNGNHVRTDGPIDTVIITNTIFADMGNVFPSNFGAGKALDLRNRPVAYVKLQNCTFINYQDRIVRHYTSNGPISNFIFDHNTCINGMSYHGFLSLGKVDSTGTGTLQITNNLLVDHFALGADTAYIRQVEFSDPGELDPLNNQPRMAWVMTNKNNAAVWNIQKNYYVITDSGAAMRSLPAPFIPRAYAGKEDPFLTLNMNKNLALQGKDTTKTFTKLQNISFTSVPGLMTSMIRWVYLPRTSTMTLAGTYSNPDYNGPGAGITKTYNLTVNGDGKEKNGGDANYKASFIATGIYALDYNRKSLDWYAWYPYEGEIGVGVGNVLNANFRSDVNLSALGTDGKVIGDTRWSYLGSVGVNNTKSQMPSKYSLDQNYPNPFNPSTSFTYEVGNAGFVSVKVYDLLGREVATLVNEFKQAGSYPATWNAASFGSGVYFYKMQSGSFTSTKKMILMK